jgi:hypothetical protein
MFKTPLSRLFYIHLKVCLETSRPTLRILTYIEKKPIVIVVYSDDRADGLKALPGTNGLRARRADILGTGESNGVLQGMKEVADWRNVRNAGH